MRNKGTVAATCSAEYPGAINKTVHRALTIIKAHINKRPTSKTTNESVVNLSTCVLPSFFVQQLKSEQMQQSKHLQQIFYVMNWEA